MVAALADLSTDLRQWDLVAEAFEGFDPGLRMDVDRIDQRAVDVENNGFKGGNGHGASEGS